MKTYTCFVDGSILNNGQPGAISASASLIENEAGEQRFLVSRNQTQATSNKAEMIAAIQALEYIKWPANFTIYSDSEYLVKGFMQRLSNWEQNNWRKLDGGVVSNIDYWKMLSKLKKHHKIEMIWVRGHENNEKHNLVDVLARKTLTYYDKFTKTPTYLNKKLICV